MAIKRKVNAVWTGSGFDGQGTLSSANKFFDQTPYSFKGRFENEDGKMGTNPEELIAAAHVGCYAMALSVGISKAGFEAERVDANATVIMEKGDGGFSITEVKLQVEGKVPGMSEAQFMEIAEGAKAGCPVSRALGAIKISMEAAFIPA
jgi:osmotically inducible protein OsmC